ncbi:MAG: hypothetical protein PHU99_09670 [Candidatus Cloacimonetes bacterium]|jgi:hypothetical protein|nr:hypothetical protein [Candidatus Cloacimonadota bacterium]MDY0338056.1 hypothetical protein [Candidatus Cloacimonadaceae bacterium]MCB5269650.1 hypothetical protein [Candidatus Cloacimonadota bacterium]MDD2543734.1 hypothetical protein [Candidatus Cloacimonadota bacterium]MDD2683689.1 hypothetical protein [Candidatus Cloacimonadota bacterium]
MKKQIVIIFAILLMAGNVIAQTVRTRIMSFENPGNRRILKTEDYSHWYYRSLPERTMRLNVEGVERIQMRSFGIEALRNPQFHVLIGQDKYSYDLKLNHRLEGYYMYETVEFDIPENTRSIEILCYPRSIYMRAFQMITIQPKPKKVVIPNMELKAHAGMIDVAHNSTSSEYYTFNSTQSLKFKLNNGRDGIVYVRARLTDRSLPKFALYKDGEKVESFEFSLSRSAKFKATGVRYLTIGKKLDLPLNDSSSEYELKAESDHLFMARPLILKK